MGESGREWEDVFEGIPITDLTEKRRRIAYFVDRSTYGRDEREELIGDLLDDSIVFTEQELDDLEIRARMSERLPSADYAPRQKDLSRWIRSFCDL